MLFPKRFQSVVHALLFLSLSIVSTFSCDPILESLIFARDSSDDLDRAFRDISTSLGEAGRVYRDGGQAEQELAMVRSVWLGIYQRFWTRPPDFYAANPDDWHQKMDGIAHAIRDLAKVSLPQDGHTRVVKLQSLLVELYEPVLKRGFLERQNMLRHMIALHVRAFEEKLEEERQDLASRILREWEIQAEELKRHGATDAQLPPSWPENLLAENRQQEETLAGMLKSQQIWWFENSKGNP